MPTGDLLHPVSEEPAHNVSLGNERCLVTLFTLCCFLPAGADKKAEAGAGAATEFQFVSIDFCFQASTCMRDTAVPLVIIMVEIVCRVEVDISSLLLQRGGFGRGRGQQPQ